MRIGLVRMRRPNLWSDVSTSYRAASRPAAGRETIRSHPCFERSIKGWYLVAGSEYLERGALRRDRWARPPEDAVGKTFSGESLSALRKAKPYLKLRR